MKGLLAIFFSVALIVSQAASIDGRIDIGGQKQSTARCCGHCGNCGSCDGQACCTAKNDSSPEQRTPAAPSRGVSRTDWQLSTAIVVQLLPEAASESVASPSSFSIRSCFAAPLYQRNCSYLI
jgi:hypothetical protein